MEIYTEKELLGPFSLRRYFLGGNENNAVKIYFKNDPLEQPLALYIVFFAVGIILSFGAVFVPMAFANLARLVAFHSILVAMCVFFGWVYADSPKSGLATAMVAIFPTALVLIWRVCAILLRLFS